MVSAVLELQQHALDRSNSVSDLLLRLYAIGRKLDLDEVADWADKELNGYEGVSWSDLPPYRSIQGQVRAFNPYRGWIPVQFASNDQAAALSARGAAQGASSLEDLVDGPSSGEIHMPFPDEIARRLSNSFEVTLFVSRGEVVRILNAIRTAVLNWALELEKEGVVGEGLSFTADERTAAQAVPSITQFLGPVGSATFVQAGGNIDTLAIGFDTDALRGIAAKLREVAGSEELPEKESQLVLAEAATIEAQAGSPKPKWHVVRESLNSARTVLEGAGGTVVGQALIELVKLL